jgi:hypothetical protein
MHVLLRCLAVVTLCALASCAEASDRGPAASGPTGVTDTPTDVELTCGVNGSTSLSTDVVRPQRDGVHLLVVNEYEEPVSVGVLGVTRGDGQGLGADPGSSELVLTQAPGNVDLSCTPNSQLMSGEEPRSVRVTIVDPEGLYVDGALVCEVVTSMIGESPDAPIDEGPPPLDVARDVIDGLQTDDTLLYAGYPDQPRRPVVVSREGEIVASFSMAQYEERSWVIDEYSACEGSDLPSQAG